MKTDIIADVHIILEKLKELQQLNVNLKQKHQIHFISFGTDGDSCQLDDIRKLGLSPKCMEATLLDGNEWPVKITTELNGIVLVSRHSIK